MTRASRPVVRISSSPTDGCGAARILTSSSRTRSAETLLEDVERLRDRGLGRRIDARTRAARRSAPRASRAGRPREKRSSGSPTARMSSRREIALPAERIGERVGDRIVGDRVHREVAPPQILVERAHEHDLVGPPPVAVGAFAADRSSPRRARVSPARSVSTVTVPCFSPVGMVRLRPNTLVTSAGWRRRRDVEVLGLRAAQQIAHRAADEPRLEAGVAQLLDTARRRPAGPRGVMLCCAVEQRRRLRSESLGDLGGALVERGARRRRRRARATGRRSSGTCGRARARAPTSPRISIDFCKCTSACCLSSSVMPPLDRIVPSTRCAMPAYVPRADLLGQLERAPRLGARRAQIADLRVDLGEQPRRLRLQRAIAERLRQLARLRQMIGRLRIAPEPRQRLAHAASRMLPCSSRSPISCARPSASANTSRLRLTSPRSRHAEATACSDCTTPGRSPISRRIASASEKRIIASACAPDAWCTIARLCSDSANERFSPSARRRSSARP